MSRFSLVFELFSSLLYNPSLLGVSCSHSFQSAFSTFPFFPFVKFQVFLFPLFSFVSLSFSCFSQVSSFLCVLLSTLWSSFVFLMLLLHVIRLLFSFLLLFLLSHIYLALFLSYFSFSLILISLSLSRCFPISSFSSFFSLYVQSSISIFLCLLFFYLFPHSQITFAFPSSLLLSCFSIFFPSS